MCSGLTPHGLQHTAAQSSHKSSVWRQTGRASGMTPTCKGLATRVSGKCLVLLPQSALTVAMETGHSQQHFRHKPQAAAASGRRQARSIHVVIMQITIVTKACSVLTFDHNLCLCLPARSLPRPANGIPARSRRLMGRALQQPCQRAKHLPGPLHHCARWRPWRCQRSVPE